MLSFICWERKTLIKSLNCQNYSFCLNQLSLIIIVPKGIYKINEENPKDIDYDDEGKIPDQAELSSLESWVHLNPNILNTGRITHYVNPKLNEEVKFILLRKEKLNQPLLKSKKGKKRDFYLLLKIKVFYNYYYIFFIFYFIYKNFINIYL